LLLQKLFAKFISRHQTALSYRRLYNVNSDLLGRGTRRIAVQVPLHPNE